MRTLPKARVARLAECHSQQKAGYSQDASPQNNKSSVTLHKSPVTLHKTSIKTHQPVSSLRNNSPAIDYWISELAAKNDATKEMYLKNFAKFIDFTGKTADELLLQRQENQTDKDPKIQRQIESQLIKFISAKRDDGLAPATLQIYFASIRSFFEIHYFPLRMRRGDYPKGESLGVKIARRETILKVIENKANRNKPTLKAVILFLKDSGLRISDARLFNYGDIAKQLERGDTIVPLTRITQKQKTVAKSFIGTEAIQALKIYLQQRQNGSRHVPPEELNNESPLFRTWTNGTVKRIPRGSLSSLIRQAFLRINEPNITAHSLRKYVQTKLEVAGMNVNWIDQILGHKLINSRDAYSKPTDEQLQEAYTQAYKFLRVYPDPTLKPQPNQETQTQPKTNETTDDAEYIVKQARNFNEATELIQHGFRYIATIDGIRLFRKRK